MYWPGLHGLGSGADRTVVVLCSRGFRGKANIRDLGCIVVGIVVAPEDRNSHGMTAVAQGFAIDILRFRGSGCVQRGKGSTRDVPAVRFRYHREVFPIPPYDVCVCFGAEACIRAGALSGAWVCPCSNVGTGAGAGIRTWASA